MKRLTIRTPKGAAVKMGEPANEAEARKMLMDNFHKVCEKLAHYEDMEEAERLVVLPCEVGDYIYDISEFTDGNEHPEMIIVRAYYIELSLDADGEINYCIAGYDYKKEDFGKTVFRTIEEAEAALKGGGQDE